MPTTEEFEYLLELPNVRAVEWDGEQLTVRVSKKIDIEDLDPEDNIENHVNVQFSVIDENDRPDDNASYNLLGFRSSPSEHQQKIRPIKAGVSEIHNESTAATGGQFPAVVTDTEKAVWHESVDRGDIVRTSNNHVYNLVGDADLGDKIIQPSPIDGGDLEDTVGELVGYVPIEDGVTVDIAARSINDEDSKNDVMNYESFDGRIFTGDYEDLRGRTLVKSGRTTGVTEGNIVMTNASIDVNMGDGETTTFRDMMITDNMGAGGDSGSPAFLKDSQEFCCVLFAGSPAATIYCKVENVEEEFGIEYIGERTDKTGDTSLCCQMCKRFFGSICEYLCPYC